MNNLHDNILKVLRKKTILKQAEALYEQGDVVSLEVDQFMNENLNLVFATVKDQKYYQVDLAVNKQELKLTNARCTCDKSDGYCQHIGAALFKYASGFIKQVEPEIELDDEAIKELTTLYRNQTVHQLIAENKNSLVNLEVNLDFIDYEYAAISLKIGTNKYYVIKDILTFLEMIQQHEHKKYGKDLELYHHISSFNEASQVILNFLEISLADHLVYKNNMNLKSYHQPKFFYLANARIDDFFNLIKQHNLKININNTSTIIKDTLPLINLEVNNLNKETYQLKLIDNNYQLLVGYQHLYLQNDNFIYDYHGNDLLKLVPVLKLFLDKETINLSYNTMKEFYLNVLNQVKNHFSYSSDCLDEFKPEAFSAKVLLDVIKKNTISAKVLFNYQDIEFNPLQKHNYDLVRNYQAELEIIMLLKKYFKFIDEKAGVFILDNSIDLIYNFFKHGFDDLSNLAAIYSSDKVKEIKIKESVSISMGVKVNNNLLELTVESKDFPIDELNDILTSYKEHKKYFRMRSGSFINLEETGLEQLSMFLDNLNLSSDELEDGKFTTSIYQALNLDQTLNEATNIMVDRDDYYKQIIRDLKNVKNSSFNVPSSLKHILRNYQKEGFYWLKTMAKYNFGGILADDMGIGKTIQVISLFEDLYQTKHAPSIVVCPSSLILNWYNEIQKFAPNIKVALVHGTLEDRHNTIKHYQDYDVLITSYDYLKRDIEAYQEIEFYYHILDEAHYIKNQNTRNAICVKQVRSKHRFALTGTPIENSLAEIWSIFDFLMPGYLYDYDYFKRHYEINIVKYQDEQSLNALKKMVEPFILRRIKKDVLKELPEKIESTLYLELDDETNKLYEAQISSVKQNLAQQKQSGVENKIIILAMLTKLRQLCADPRLVYDNINYVGIKVKAVMDIVQACKENNKKVLIFSQFTSVFKLLKAEFSQNKLSYFTLTGKTSKEERHRMVSEFNHDNTDIFMISLKAGGTGLNLTGAEVVIHFDPWWNLSAQNQATDRAYRLGQKNNVQVYKLICKDTIEEKILALQEVKKDLADSLILENENLISKMSIDEILELF